MAGRRFPRLPGRDRLTDGIEVKARDGGVEIDLHVVVEYGLNLAEVAATVRAASPTRSSARPASPSRASRCGSRT